MCTIYFDSQISLNKIYEAVKLKLSISNSIWVFFVFLFDISLSNLLSSYYALPAYPPYEGSSAVYFSFSFAVNKSLSIFPNIESNQFRLENLSDWPRIFNKYAIPKANPSSEMKAPTFWFLP